MLEESKPPLEEEVEELNDVELPDVPLPKVFATPFGFLDLLIGPKVEPVVLGTGAFVE
jgi:hypothetical protein